MFDENVVLRNYLTQKIERAGVVIDNKADTALLYRKKVNSYETLFNILPEGQKEMLNALCNVEDEYREMSMRYCYLMGLKNGMGVCDND